MWYARVQSEVKYMENETVRADINIPDEDATVRAGVAADGKCNACMGLWRTGPQMKRCPRRIKYVNDFLTIF